MIALWLACTPDHPIKTALEHFSEGKSALEAGDAASASAAFEAALAVHHDAAELELWLGRALAAQGDLQGAIEAATRALDVRGEWHIAHYNRACWRARAGELELAAADLSVALGGDLDLLVIAADPDLDALRADPRFRDLVPRRALPATVEAPEDAWFVGSEWTLTFEALEPEGRVVSVQATEPFSAPVAHRRTVEDLVRHEGRQARRLLIEFRVLDAGEGTSGPWTLSAGDLEATVGPVDWRFLAPPDHVAAPVHLVGDPFAVPSQLFAGLEGASARRDGELVLLRAEPGDVIAVDGELPAVSYEVRDAGEPRWIGVAVASTTPVSGAVRRAGQEILTGTW